MPRYTIEITHNTQSGTVYAVIDNNTGLIVKQYNTQAHGSDAHKLAKRCRDAYERTLP